MDRQQRKPRKNSASQSERIIRQLVSQTVDEDPGLQGSVLDMLRGGHDDVLESALNRLEDTYGADVSDGLAECVSILCQSATTGTRTSYLFAVMALVDPDCLPSFADFTKDIEDSGMVEEGSTFRLAQGWFSARTLYDTAPAQLWQAMQDLEAGRQVALPCLSAPPSEEDDAEDARGHGVSVLAILGLHSRKCSPDEVMPETGDKTERRLHATYSAWCDKIYDRVPGVRQVLPPCMPLEIEDCLEHCTSHHIYADGDGSEETDDDMLEEGNWDEPSSSGGLNGRLDELAGFLQAAQDAVPDSAVTCLTAVVSAGLQVTASTTDGRVVDRIVVESEVLPQEPEALDSLRAYIHRMAGTSPFASTPEKMVSAGNSAIHPEGVDLQVRVGSNGRFIFEPMDESVPPGRRTLH
jgi:hypothetical protein